MTYEEILEEIVAEKEPYKIKVSSAEIVVHGTKEKPYYEIRYYDLSDNEYHIGFSSYSLDIVFGYLDGFFEMVDKHMNDGKDINVPTKENDRWIPVEEKPNKTGYYLVQLSRKLPNEDYSDRVVVLYNGEEKEFMTYSNLIIAWQPLPEQYRPEKGAKIC
ncbi:hypothetical protein B5F53_11555 [Blautia sp. An249]|uniref:hypothetical protein n=1 Tax=Blautia sp. An249 TaxID=1965603 RepID=UPI000B3816E8|nr:hypothetical protein [Blautia sp. An249]OUO78176.1 hypothetical protein B5F53_11555 [Blautia sp. An249]